MLEFIADGKTLRYTLSLQSLMLAWGRGRKVTITDVATRRRVVGLIGGIEVESGYCENNAPHSFVVTVIADDDVHEIHVVTK